MVDGVGLERMLSVSDARKLPLSQFVDVDSLDDKDTFLSDMGMTYNEYRTLLEKSGVHFRNTNREKELFTHSEIKVLGTMLSEHASYKSSKLILKTLPTQSSNVVVPVGQDAGAVYIGKDKDGKGVLFWAKTESHNHPSHEFKGLFGDGYQGTMTGIGGILRDIFCMNAEPIGVFDGQRYGDIRVEENRKFISTNVKSCTAGIADYGNPMGVPHWHGSIQFSKDMDGNTLQQVGAVGISRIEDIIPSALPDEDVGELLDVYIGKATDTTGMGGSVFASKELEASDSNMASVQDGNPFMERVEFELMREFFKTIKEKNMMEEVYLQDMGAAGLLCSSIEPGSKSEMQYHQVINGDLVPNTFPENLDADELAGMMLTSETQERFFGKMSPRAADIFLDLANNKYELGNLSNGAAARIVGRTDASEKDGTYIFTVKGERVVDLPVDIITEGVVYERESKPKDKSHLEDFDTSSVTIDDVLDKIISDPNIADDTVIHENYDKHIGRESARPVLTREYAPAATAEVEGLEAGVAGCFTGQTLFGVVDPKFQAENAVLSAYWRLAAVGASMTDVSNNANYGNPEIPEHFWEFEQGQEGVKNALAQLHFAPDYKNMLREDGMLDGADTIAVTGGNVSFYNVQPNRDSINPSTVIMGKGWTRDPSVAVTSHLKKDGGNLYLVGKRKNQISGSAALNAISDNPGKTIDQFDYEQEEKNMYATIEAIHSGAVTASDVVGKGGLAATVTRMASNGNIGAEIDIADTYDSIDEFTALFSENPGVVMQVKDEEKFREIMEEHDADFYSIGEATDSGFSVTNGIEILAQRDDEYYDIYRNGLRNVLEGAE